MIKRILLGIILNGLALYAVTLFLSDINYTGGIKFFLVAGFIIGFLNIFVKPLMKLLSFPLVILTVGIFTLVINAIIFWLTMKMVNAIHFSDVSVIILQPATYFIAALVFGLTNWFLHIIIRNK